MRSTSLVLAALAGLAASTFAAPAGAFTPNSGAGLPAAAQTVDPVTSVHCRPFKHRSYNHGWSYGCRGGGVSVNIHEREGVRGRVRIHEREGVRGRVSTHERSSTRTDVRSRERTNARGEVKTGTNQGKTGTNQGRTGTTGKSNTTGGGAGGGGTGQPSGGKQ